jgi:hypothetical protein
MKFNMLRLIWWVLSLSFLHAANTNSPPAPSPSQKIKICSSHPNIDALLKKGSASYTLPTTHPTIQPLLKAYMPRGK